MVGEGEGSNSRESERLQQQECLGVVRKGGGVEVMIQYYWRRDCDRGLGTGRQALARGSCEATGAGALTCLGAVVARAGAVER